MTVLYRCPHVSLGVGTRREGGSVVSIDDYAKMRRTIQQTPEDVEWEHEALAVSNANGKVLADEDGDPLPGAETQDRWTAWVTCPVCGDKVKVVTDESPETEVPA